MQIIRNFIGSEDGATLAEYVLLLAFVFLVVFGAVEALGLDLVPFFQKVADEGFS